jgi:hypothetical protein
MKKYLSLAACVLTAIGIASAVLSGAGPRKLTITIYSDPAGATIYQNGQGFGYAPTKLNYKVTPDFRAGNDCMRLTPLKVRWASGAEVSMDDLTACPQNGGNQQLTFVRPNGFEGRELDVYFAVQLAAAAQQRAADRAAALAELSRKLTAALSPPAITIQPLNCLSTVVGTSVFTNCY